MVAEARGLSIILPISYEKPFYSSAILLISHPSIQHQTPRPLVLYTLPKIESNKKHLGLDLSAFDFTRAFHTRRPGADLANWKQKRTD
jgi:hypothetical protein